MRKIKLQNFQSHKDTTIEVAEIMTAITGRSHHGKSSIIRAIQLVKDNRPTGNEFVRWDTKETNVSIDNVTFKKVGSKNSYIIEGQSAPFKALNRAVPEEVTKELNLGDVNIQDQHESIFLLNESPGKVAKKLSELSDLQPTVTALQFISSKKRTVTSDIGSTAKAIDTVEQQLHELRHVDAMDDELCKIERKQRQAVRLREKHSQLYIAHKNAVSAHTELISLPNTDALQPAKRLLALYSEIEELKARRIKLDSTVGEVLELEYRLSFDPSKLLRKAKRIKTMYEKRNKLQEATLKCSGLQGSIAGLTLRRKELIKLKKELMGDTCPLCGALEDDQNP